LQSTELILGFDGVVFKFNGEAGRDYNLVSSPFLQLNGEVDRGLDREGGHFLPSVIRSAVAMWEQFSVFFSFSHLGEL
jgi:hypothetical protein